MKMKMVDFTNYLIFRNGCILNINKKKFVKAHTQTAGYKQIQLTDDWGKKHSFLIHRLLAINYIDNPGEKTCVDHMDRNKQNNSLNNLRWVTYSENNHNRCIMKNNVTGYRGISWDAPRKKYRYNQKRYNTIEEIVKLFNLEKV